MSSSARVTSIDAVRDFRAALCNFIEETGQSICNIDMEIQRFYDWLSNDQLNFWSRQVRACEEKLAEAKNAMHQRKLASFEDNPSVIQEKKDVEKCKRRLEEAEDKVKAVKRWTRVVEQEIEEYKGKREQLSSAVQGDLPRGVSMLERIVGSLDAYVDMRSVPETAVLPSVSGGSSTETVKPAAIVPAATSVTEEAVVPATPSDTPNASETSTH
jgi:hypothetical protein